MNEPHTIFGDSFTNRFELVIIAKFVGDHCQELTSPTETFSAPISVICRGEFWPDDCMSCMHCPSETHRRSQIDSLPSVPRLQTRRHCGTAAGLCPGLRRKSFLAAWGRCERCSILTYISLHSPGSMWSTLRSQ